MIPPERDNIAEYSHRFAVSAGLHQRARAVLAGGYAHDTWRLAPFPVSFASARGCTKVDVSGNTVIDYWMGHGALLFGHAFPPIVDAVSRQAGQGSHLGGSTESQVAWAESVCRLVPSADRVRFTTSGTEATLLALRVARAYTGRALVVRIDGHYHGWHDEAMAHFVAPGPAGLMPHAASHVIVKPIAALDTIRDLVLSGDVACVILEPGGGCAGSCPVPPDALASLRACTSQAGALLVFDEVVSGFRWCPGGAQEALGVTPDLTVLGKILCGGLPGGAVAGATRVMAVFDGAGEGEGPGGKVPHSGTFNANPLSATAGIVSLEYAAGGGAQREAASRARSLADAVNGLARHEGLDLALFAESSVVHLQIGARAAGVSAGPSAHFRRTVSVNAGRHAALRRALLLEGVDIHPSRGWVSAAHDDDAIARTISAFSRAIGRLGRVLS